MPIIFHLFMYLSAGTVHAQGVRHRLLAPPPPLPPPAPWPPPAALAHATPKPAAGVAGHRHRRPHQPSAARDLRLRRRQQTPLSAAPALAIPAIAAPATVAASDSLPGRPGARHLGRSRLRQRPPPPSATPAVGRSHRRFHGRRPRPTFSPPVWFSSLCPASVLLVSAH